MSNATPCKLKSGDWGARVSGPVSKGDTITITTKAGKSWTALVAHVVWSKDNTSIVATESAKRPQSATRGHRPQRNRYGKGRCRECGETLQTWHDGYSHGLCHDCL